MQPKSAYLVFLAFIAYAGSQPSAGTHGAHPVHALPMCQHMVGNVPPQKLAALRDIIQDMQLQRRYMREHQITLERRGENADKPGWTLAYNDSLSDAEHTALQAVHRNASMVLQQTAIDMLDALKQAGHVADSVTLKAAMTCVMARLNPRLFPNLPTVSFIMQYFNRPWSIERYIQMLQGCGNSTELVVNVDNRGDEKVWAEIVNRTKGSVVPVFSANVHEARAYNRLAKLARGLYLVLLQDDELPLDMECKWLPDVVTIFERFPSIGVLGLKGFVYGPKWNYDNQTGTHFRDPVTKVLVSYVMATDFAPMAVRKAAYKFVGGLDESSMEPGECGIWTDWELCQRMWSSGWTVAYHEVKRKGDGHDSGTHRPENKERCWERQKWISRNNYMDRWDDTPYEDQVTMYVRYLNLRTLEPAYEKCPFGGGCNITSYISEYGPADTAGM